MSGLRQERGHDGKLSIWIFPAGDRNLLRRCSDCFVSDFGAQQTERFDAMDQIFWDFLAGSHHIVLRWDKGSGIAVAAGNTATATEQLAQRVAEHLAARVILTS